MGLDLRLAVPRAAGNGGDEAQGAQDAPEQGSLRLLLTLAGARFSVPELMAEVPGGLVTGHGLFFDDAKVGGDLSVLLSDPDALMRLVAALTGEAQAGLPLASANLEAALSGTLDAPGLVLKASVPGIVLDALNVGMLMMNRRSEDVVEKAILAFVTHYGLLGLMTALPTTPSFMDYEAVYLPKNHFIKEESMATEDYLALFYPFDKLDVVKKGVESSWNVSGDNMMIALTMTFMEEPMAKNMSFQREYAEPYDWVAQQFKDWAFTLTTSILYYNDYDSIDEDTRNICDACQPFCFFS